VPWVWAREARDRLFIGLDANAAGLRELSGRAFRARLPNLIYARASAEDLPPELRGVADRVTVVLPWGSLLAAVARPSREVLRGIRALCRPHAAFTVILGHDPVRDQAEIARLGVTAMTPSLLAGLLGPAYRDAGFALQAVRALPQPELARWPSTWTRRLSHGSSRSFIQMDAAAGPGA
jgi:16S rRNA (adenine(1408)-N(1))-methyltransferase